MSNQVNQIPYACPGCNKKHDVFKKDLITKIPLKILPGTTIYGYTKTPCNNYAELEFMEVDGWNKGIVREASLLTENDYLTKIKSKEINPHEEEKLSYFRPLNKEEAEKKALDMNLISGKYKTEPFNFQGRLGTFLYNDASLAFLSLSEQNNDSLERIVHAAENLSYQILEKRQNAAAKKKETPQKNVQLYFIDSKKNCETFGGMLAKRKEQYAGAKNPGSLKNINAKDNLLVIKKNVISRIKSVPAMVARTVFFAYLPIAGMIYSGYRGVKFIKTIKDLKAKKVVISNDIDKTNKEINGRDLSKYNSEKSSLEKDLSAAQKTMDTEYNDIRPGTTGNSNLSELDNFMLANGAQLIDSDGDGFTDAYYIPSTGQTTSDPFADGLITPGNVGQENYNKYSSAWNDLQEYEAARLDFSKIQGDLDNLIKGNGDLPNLEQTLNNLKNDYTINEGNITNNSVYLGIAAGFLFGLGLSIGISIWYNNHDKKMKYGSSLRPLKKDELQSLHNNNLSLDDKKILAPENYGAKELDNLKKKNIEYAEELKLKKENLEQIIQASAAIVSSLDANQKEMEKYNELTPVYLEMFKYLKNLHEATNPNAKFDLDFLIKKNLIGVLGIDYNNEAFKNNNITKELFEQTLPQFNNWDILIKDGRKLNDKYIPLQKERPPLDKRIKELNGLITESNENIAKYEAASKNSESSMFDHLIADPGLIFTKNFINFGGKYNQELISSVAENKFDLDNARKKIKKIKKAMIKEQSL